MGQILRQIFDQVLDGRTRVFGPEKTPYSSTGTEKDYILTSIVFLGPIKKTGYPPSTNDIAKRYLFVNDYTAVNQLLFVLTHELLTKVSQCVLANSSFQIDFKYTRVAE